MLAKLLRAPRLRLRRTASRRNLKRLISEANAANSAGHWSKAEAGYASALKIDESLAAIWVQYGHSLKEQGFLRRAERAYRKALSLDGAAADTHLQLGHVLKLQGQLPDAISSYRIAHWIDPSSPHSGRELDDLGVKLPAGAEIASAPLATAPPLAFQDAGAQHYAVDPDFVQAVYGRDAASTRLSDGRYRSLAHLLDQHDLTDTLLAHFDDQFYFFTNAMVRDALQSPNRLRSLVHFCEVGISAVLQCNPGRKFDPDFYRETYLRQMSFTPSNAYRHWLNLGLSRGWSGNQREWLKSSLGVGVEGTELLPPALLRTVVAPAHSQSWNDLFDQYLAHRAAPSCPTALRAYIDLFSAIADRCSRDGRDDLALGLLERVFRLDPGYLRTRQHYADCLLRQGCHAQALSIYDDLIERRAFSVWTFINKSSCHEAIGEFKPALRALHDGVSAFPGDQGIRRRFDDLSQRFLSREWRFAEAEGEIERSDAAQQRVEHACHVVSTLIGIGEQQAPQPIRAVAIVGNQDLAQCRFYRIDQKIEQIEAGGYIVTFYDHRSGISDFLEEVYKFQAVIFYRVAASHDIIAAIARARELGLVTFYEIDDLIFDAREYPASFESYGGQVSRQEYNGLKLGVPLFAHAMSLCEFGIASTPALAARMTSLVSSGRVFLHRNAFGKMHARYATSALREPQDGPVTIFYGSGTKAHKEDFQELVEPALVSVVRRYGSRVVICLVGHFGLTDRLASISGNIEIFDPIWDLNSYWSMLRSVDINIAVLKPSPMADSKSEIKWMEAAMFGVPSIVSDTETYRQVITPDVTGVVCGNSAEWADALDRLVADASLRRRIGAQARRQVLADYSMEAMSANLQTIFKEAVEGRCRPKRPKIVIVNVFYPPQAFGGATRVVHDNVRHLAAHYGDEFDIEVFTSIEGGLEPYAVSSYVQDGVKVTGITTPHTPDLDRVLSDARMGQVFSAYLDEIKPALIHFHCVQRLTLDVVMAAWERAVPYIITAHDGWWISSQQFLLDEQLQSQVYDYADPQGTLRVLGRNAYLRMLRIQEPLFAAARVLAVSEPFGEIYHRCGVPHVVTIANGISSLPAVVRMPPLDGRVRLGFIGGLERHKGSHLIRYAFESHAFPNLNLTIIDHSMSVGDQRSEAWGPNKVNFLPRRSQEQVGELYGEIDVLLAPSVWPESYGLVTREALHCGCWVVASDRGSIGEYVSNGENGYLIDVSTPDELIRVLMAINGNPNRYLSSPASATVIRQASQQSDDLAMLYRTLIAGQEDLPSVAVRLGRDAKTRVPSST